MIVHRNTLPPFVGITTHNDPTGMQFDLHILGVFGISGFDDNNGLLLGDIIMQ